MFENCLKTVEKHFRGQPFFTCFGKFLCLQSKIEILLKKYFKNQSYIPRKHDCRSSFIVNFKVSFLQIYNQTGWWLGTWSWFLNNWNFIGNVIANQWIIEEKFFHPKFAHRTLDLFHSKRNSKLNQKLIWNR